MQLEFTHKDIKETRRLGNAIDAGLIPLKDIQAFFTGLQRKVESSAGPRGIRRAPKKEQRKDKYKTKLKAA